jgi:hypothetical protein
VLAVAGEHGGPVGAAQADVDVAGVALALVVLRHEREALAVPGRDLLGAGLVDAVVVARGQCGVVPERDLVLAGVALALGRLHVHAGAGHAVADVAQERLEPAGAEHRVVHVVLVAGPQVAVSLVPGLFVGVVEDDELQLGAAVGGEVALGEPVELAAQHLPGRRGDRAALDPLDVGEHQRGALLPRHQAQRVEVGPQHEVAVAALPGRHGVAVDGVHLHVDGEQVVAGLGGVRDDLVEEVLGGAALALQPALHVGDRDEDGVDGPVRDQLAQPVDGEHAVAVSHEKTCPPKDHA